MIKAVIFDFGNVICKLDNNIFLRRIAGYTKSTAAELYELIYVKSDLPRRYETGLITSHLFYTEIVALCGMQIEKEEFIRTYTDIFTPIPATFDLVKKLKPCYKLALLSNTSEWDFRYGIRPIEIFDLFDTVTLSYEVKAMKPHPEIFSETLAKLECQPGECVFIDDSGAFVAAAKKMGLHGIVYTGHAELVAELLYLGIKVK